MRELAILSAGMLAILLPAGVASADEEADRLVQEALPLMFHTCDSVVEASDGDGAFIVEVVSKMTALIFVNREIDYSEYAATDEEKATIRESFIEALRTGCEADRDALLGGVVDAAVKSSLGL